MIFGSRPSITPGRPIPERRCPMPGTPEHWFTPRRDSPRQAACVMHSVAYTEIRKAKSQKKRRPVMPERNVKPKFLGEPELTRIHAQWHLHKELAADQSVAGIQFSLIVESLLGHIAALEAEREKAGVSA